jgi:hypothetical protein
MVNELQLSVHKIKKQARSEIKKLNEKIGLLQEQLSLLQQQQQQQQLLQGSTDSCSSAAALTEPQQQQQQQQQEEKVRQLKQQLKASKETVKAKATDFNLQQCRLFEMQQSNGLQEICIAETRTKLLQTENQLADQVSKKVKHSVRKSELRCV